MKTHIKLVLASAIFIVVSCNKTSKKTETTSDTPSSKYSLNTGVNDGFKTEKYENGNKKFEGNMKAGKREGEWFMYYENGSVWSRCCYVDDKKQGKSIVFLPDGKKVYEGMYEADKPVGEWIYYNKDGSIAEKKMQ